MIDISDMFMFMQGSSIVWSEALLFAVGNEGMF